MAALLQLAGQPPLAAAGIESQAARWRQQFEEAFAVEGATFPCSLSDTAEA